MKLLLVLTILILTGCASTKHIENFEGAFKDPAPSYIIEDMVSDIETCKILSSIYQDNCYKNVSNTFRVNIKSRYSYVTDQQLSRLMSGLSEESSSIKEMGIKLEDRVRTLNKDAYLNQASNEELCAALKIKDPTKACN